MEAESPHAKRHAVPPDELDLVTTFREVMLAGPWSFLLPRPCSMRRSSHVGIVMAVRQLLPRKSLDTRPDGSAWLNAMDRIMTPLSLDDLGQFELGPLVGDLGAMLGDVREQALPYCICPATRTIVVVQHEAGFAPTEAPFMFVGQRQQVKQIVAVPWAAAFEYAETLPAAADLGPVLVVQMTGRCGSTVLTKALEWLDVGCQSVSEPTVFEDVHKMLERGLCSRMEAVRLLRTFLLMLVHQRRCVHPDKPMIIVKNRTLAATWRHCDLLPGALPEAKQLFQWRTLEDVVGSFDAALSTSMVSPIARCLHRYGLDGWLWRFNGSPATRWMERNARILREEPLLANPECPGPCLDVRSFMKEGSLGFITLMSLVDGHVGATLGRRGIFHHIMRYEDLMERKSACVRDLFDSLGWLHYVPDPSKLGSPAGDEVFYKDAHAGGGLAKSGGTTLGGDGKHLKAAKQAATANRANAHLPPERASAVRRLMSQHHMLKAYDFNLAAAAGALAKKAVEEAEPVSPAARGAGA